ncbi:MAG: hypothetical protein E7304_01250 [Butyrivibrio sp.]|uniref:hypothetical protein n=1 Tax=Butyrivibrio sp. TaxID=28121 RepID=UPI001EB72F6C|nr:hypothetical protein [Butyrivibrio sp.]MBE5840011.1 hypothetical protein [Butyrivibrio sp.]
MGETKKALFARNLVCICIDSAEEGDLQGKIWHQYSDDAIAFGNVADMIIKMDNLYDQWDFPQKGLEQREFTSTKRSEELLRTDKLPIDEIQKKCGTRNIQNKKGELATFVVQVAFRQKATWQGRAICSENGKEYDFGSAKALIDIMDTKIHGER